MTIKRLAYSEFEITFPTPFGMYKIHIPAGEITARDIATIKIEISKILLQVTEKARKMSSALYSDIKKNRQEITEKILAKLKRLLGQEMT